MVALGFPAIKHEKLRSAQDQAAGQVMERLQHSSGYLALRDIACVPHDGRIHLRGQVPSYYLKQVALSIASELECACELVNEIEVVAPSARAPMGFDCGAAVIPVGRFPV